MTDAGCESGDRPRIPATAVKGRRTPTFSLDTVPAALTRAHVTTTWAEVVVLAGSVLFVDDTPRRGRSGRRRAGAGHQPVHLAGLATPVGVRGRGCGYHVWNRLRSGGRRMTGLPRVSRGWIS